MKIFWTKKAKLITNFAAIVRAQMAPKMTPFGNEIFSPKSNSLDNLQIKISGSIVFLKQHLKGHLLKYNITL